MVREMQPSRIAFCCRIRSTEGWRERRGAQGSFGSGSGDLPDGNTNGFARTRFTPGYCDDRMRTRPLPANAYGCLAFGVRNSASSFRLPAYRAAFSGVRSIFASSSPLQAEKAALHERNERRHAVDAGSDDVGELRWL
jgi:hypothetical protein